MHIDTARGGKLPRCAGKLMKCSVAWSSLVDMLLVSQVHTNRLVVRAYKHILCCIGKNIERLTGQTIRFTVNWVDHSLIRALQNIISHGSIEVSAEKDKEFYTNKLQTVHGVDLPNVGASEQHLSHLNGVLEPMRLTLQAQDYLGGSSPSYADFAAAGAFAWARSVSPIKLLEESDSLYIWRACVFENFHHDLTETIGYPV